MLASFDLLSRIGICVFFIAMGVGGALVSNDEIRQSKTPRSVVWSAVGFTVSVAWTAFWVYQLILVFL